jgi:hypothetical protein
MPTKKHLSICLPTGLPVYLSICLPMFLSTFLPHLPLTTT